MHLVPVRALSQPALGYTINGRNIAELSAMEVGDLLSMIRDISDPRAESMVATLTERLPHVVEIGLECQRIKLASESSAVDVPTAAATRLRMSAPVSVRPAVAVLADASAQGYAARGRVWSV